MKKQVNKKKPNNKMAIKKERKKPLKPKTKERIDKRDKTVN